MPVSCTYKVLSLEMRPLCKSWCPQQMGRGNVEWSYVLALRDLISQPKGMLPGRGEPWPATHPPMSATFLQGWWSSSWDHEHSPNSQGLIPTPRNGQHIAMRLPPVPQKPRTSPSTDDDRILRREASLKQGSIVLNCIPQCVWLWANRWCPGHCKVPYKVLQTSDLVWYY